MISGNLHNEVSKSRMVARPAKRKRLKKPHFYTSNKCKNWSRATENFSIGLFIWYIILKVHVSAKLVSNSTSGWPRSIASNSPRLRRVEAFGIREKL